MVPSRLASVSLNDLAKVARPVRGKFLLQQKELYQSANDAAQLRKHAEPSASRFHLSEVASFVRSGFRLYAVWSR